MVELADGRVVLTYNDSSAGADTGGDNASGTLVKAAMFGLRDEAQNRSGDGENDQSAGAVSKDVL